ncbi:MAG TPA: hypothetical protein PKB07_04350 [Flavilitoribacter sp.]|nr:hypothetical protein [Flavilitoribacter sp.]
MAKPGFVREANLGIFPFEAGRKGPVGEVIWVFFDKTASGQAFFGHFFVFERKGYRNSCVTGPDNY